MSPVPNSNEKLETAGWARLIPGEASALGSKNLRGKRKLPQAVSLSGFIPEKVTEIPCEESAPKALPLFVPAPLQKRGAWAWLRTTAADFALIGLNWLLAGALLVPLHRSFPQVWGFRFAAGAPDSLLGFAVLHAALITLLGYSEGLYGEDSNLRRQVRILAKSVILATAVLCFAHALQGAPWTISGLFCGVGVLDFVVLSCWRWQSGRRHGRMRSSEVRNVLIVGAGHVGRRAASFVEQHPEEWVLCGFLDDERPLGDGVIGRVGDLARLARTAFVDEVILAAPHDRNLALQVFREARRLRLDVEIIPDLFGCKPEDEETRVAGMPLICLHSERLPELALVLKRLVDILLAGLALIALSPLLAAITALIRLGSSGPVLYCALRAGRKGNPFRCYKFRTMVSNADALKDSLRENNQRTGPFFKIVQDPRVTRIGRFLRRYSLDELPQLWNVLRGEMSLVGPRPHPLDDLAAYQVEHLARLDVTPGLTGLWQVTARCDPSFERGMELDREYIRTWSLASDLRILLKTISTVVRGSGI